MFTERTEQPNYYRSISQIKTDRVDNDSIPNLKYRSPRMILRELQSTKPKEDYQKYAGSMDERYQQFLKNKQQTVKHTHPRLSQCKKRIAELVNQDNRFSLQNLKKQNEIGAQKMICDYIVKHKKYYNKLVINLPQYDREAPFKLEPYSFVDKILPYSHIVQKKLGFDEDNLQRNSLVLERIILERRFKQQ